MQTLDELNAQIAATLAPFARTETVALDDACSRVLAEAITSNIELPVADVSAMDGYAFTANSGDTLTLIGESIAGRPFAGTVGAGECVRIMTGAVVPTGANTVEMQENTTRDGGRITLTRPTPPRANIRYRGEELQLGETVLQPGKILSAADVLLLAALGCAHPRYRTAHRRPAFQR
jgi:molybdopterin biosynthesis moeA protein